MKTAPVPVVRRYLSIAEFCSANAISRSFLYKLWAAGRGPARKQIGDRVLIPADADLAEHASKAKDPRRRRRGRPGDNGGL
jgi:predicted DNA-binding transcriptional regulator AlpA